MVFTKMRIERRGDVGYRYCPLGPCLELAPIENVLGDTNFIIRKSVFQAVGGFSEDTEGATEDWELLTKLMLANYKLDVIPKSLFWYRTSPTSRSRTTMLYDSLFRPLQPWRSTCPPIGFGMAYHLQAMYQRVSPGQIESLRELLLRVASLTRVYLKSTRIRGIVRWLRRVIATRLLAK